MAHKEAPVNAGGNRRLEWASDAVAQVLRDLDIEYISLNPGASYRGFHDSIVNHLGNERPQMLLCLHEEHAVAIAHGYAKVTGRAMAAALHSNVGLMHATMAIFNAWIDRAPVVIFGATGPVDAARRRPWIDWIHTSADQAGLIRNFIKWDDQPASADAAVEAVYRGYKIAMTAPAGPVYLCLDAGLQETALAVEPVIQPAERFRPGPPPQPATETVARAAGLLAGARNPVILFGRGNRTREAWDRRVALAERLGARVLTDLKTAAVFPTSHPLHFGGPQVYFLSSEAAALLREADVVLSLDWVDLGGTLRMAWDGKPPTATVIEASLSRQANNGWTMDYYGLAPVDVDLCGDPDAAVAALLAALPVSSRAASATGSPPAPPAAASGGPNRAADAPVDIRRVATALRAAVGDAPASLVRISGAWPGELWPFEDPLDYLGADGGAGIGSGLGIAVGAALALEPMGRLPIAVLGDGETAMGMSALWTAAHYRLQLLVVVANNRSFFNDEVHQDRIARVRGRDPANRWIGQRMDDPPLDFAALARAQGWDGIGPVGDGALDAALSEAVATVRAGGRCLVEVLVEVPADAASRKPDRPGGKG